MDIEKQYQKYHQQLYRIAYSYLRHHQNAEDVLQVSYEKAIQKCDQLDDPSKLKSWLIRIVINECNQNHRISKKQMEIQQRIAINHDSSFDFDYIQHIELKDALYLLCEEDRNLIALKYLLGYRQKEIAGILTLPVGTVKSKLSRSLDKLRIIMGGDENE